MNRHEAQQSEADDDNDDDGGIDTEHTGVDNNMESMVEETWRQWVEVVDSRYRVE